MANKNKNESFSNDPSDEEMAQYPDTTHHVTDGFIINLDRIKDHLDNNDEAIAKTASDIAKRQLEIKHTDINNEIAGMDAEVTNLKLEYEETGDENVGKALEQIKPHHLQAEVEKRNLPPNPN